MVVYIKNGIANDQYLSADFDKYLNDFCVLKMPF